MCPGIPRQKCLTQRGIIVPIVDVGECHCHVIDIISPPTIVKVDDTHLVLIGEQIVPLVQVGMDKPHAMGDLLHRLARRLDPLRGDGKHGQVVWGVHSDRGREAVPPRQHITKTRAPGEWRMVGRDKRRRVLV